MTKTVMVAAALLAALTVTGCYSPYHGYGYGRGDRYYGHSHYDRDGRWDNDRYDRDRYRDDRYRGDRYR